MSGRAPGDTDHAANLWERAVTAWESNDGEGAGPGALGLLEQLGALVDEWQGFLNRVPAPPAPVNDTSAPRVFTLEEVRARAREVQPLAEAVFLSVGRVQGEGDWSGFVSDLRRLLELYGVTSSGPTESR